MKRNKLIYNFNNIIGKRPKRSTFYRTNMHKTTLNTGDLIPVFWDEILPGDTYNMETKAIVRQTTMIKPIFDATYLEIMYFFVPMRLTWENTQKFFGENTDEWAVKDAPTIPQIQSPDEGWKTGTIADYMGLPINKELKISALPFRAYAKIFNDWFRDENLQKASHINTGDSTTKGTNGDNYVTDLEAGGMPAKANKRHDYFTSCLPAPQKGDAVKLNLGGSAPVHAKSLAFDTTGDSELKFDANQGTGLYHRVWQSGQSLESEKTGAEPAGELQKMIPNNLYADLSKATQITINELRQAIAYQQMLEKDARSGTRYVEFLKAHFGVDSPDARQQRSEYLGGLKQPMNVQQIPQTNSTDSTSPQANLAAYGESKLRHNSFKKTFTEHGFVIGLAVVRYDHTYQQGLERAWTRKDRNDLYDPIFANLGEQPVLNKEIFYQANVNIDNEIFGFQEAWADYRFKISKVTGKMRSMEKDSLDVWHFADNYKELPHLSENWIKEDQTNVDRTLAIKSTGEKGEPQFQADFYFNNKVERAMPTYSIPGLKRI